MADFSLEDIKTLRERLGTGMVDTKNALVEAGGDLEKATELLRLKGAKGNAKRADRSTSEGVVAAKATGGSATMIELACETDFVAKGDKFVALSERVLDAVAAAGAKTVEEALAADLGGKTVAAAIDEEAAVIGEKFELRRVSVIEADVENERRIVEEISRGEGKPEAALPKIIEGRLGAYYKQVALLEQDYARDNKVSIAKVAQDAGLTVTGFARFKVGA
jgi:elongation factor Ts